MPRKTFDEDDAEEVVNEAPVEKKRSREEKESQKASKKAKVESSDDDSSSSDEEERKRKEKKAAKKAQKKKAKAEKRAKEQKEKEEEEKKVKDKKNGKEEKKDKTEKKEVKEVKEAKKEKVEQKVVEQKKKDKVQKSEPVDDADTEAWRNANNITILGEGCPAPYKTFAAASFPSYISTALSTLKFDKPTPIQSQAWPLALGGRDMIGLAETGSGKTLGFMLPAVVHITNKSERKGPSVLVLAPTRELAQQIEEVTAKTCGAANIKSCCVYGGVPKHDQVKSLKGAEVIIATPGRLLDFMQEGTVKLNNITYLVFDEADRMLDMGFEVQINQIMRDITSPTRQTLMFSATWPNDVQRLASKFFKNPVRITIGSENLAGATRVQQIVEVCEEWEKKKKLKALLPTIFKNNCKILIFMLYKKSCENLSVELARDGWPVVSIHGDKSQQARNAALADFKASKSPILVATDVAARGLDIKEVKYVVNVEFPLKCEDYVHRIGRTGRAGETGIAYTYFTADDKNHARELVQILQEGNQTVSDKLAAIADRAPGIKPKKTALQQLYGDFAPSDPTLLTKKATRIVFD